MHRINPETGEVLVPHAFSDGTYGAADPSLGNRRHHANQRIIVRSIDELREYFLKGWPIWMSIVGTRDRRLISKGIVDRDPPHMVPKGATMSGEGVKAVPVASREAVVEQTRPVPPIQIIRQVAGLELLATMSDVEILAETNSPRKLLLGSHVHRTKHLTIAYAPFDYINTSAEIVIVGITPGKQQMTAAIEEARKAIQDNLSDNDILARAKVHASFVGTMRTNLVKLMDAVGLNDFLSITSTASLWGTDSHLAHFTSALRYPTFVDGENYSRSPDLNDVPFLFDRCRDWLKTELSSLNNPVVVPMGDMVSEVLKRVGREMSIPQDRILFGMPHASGANNGPIAKFLDANGTQDVWRNRYTEIKAKVDRLSSTQT